MDSIAATMRIAGSALQAQGLRMRVVSENIANAKSAGSAPGADPFRRKTVSFESKLDRAVGAELVKVKRVGQDASDFISIHDPSHPAANSDGYVKMPNVNSLIEMTDLREASRSYEASLNIIEQARSIAASTLALLNTN
ncbi:MAG: flagellar basal body rod protein FlgC [Pseudomonadota bacterium]